MAWKPTKVTEDLREKVMAVYAADFEKSGANGPTSAYPTFDEWLEQQGVRKVERWSAAENKLKAGKLVTVHGVEEQTSFLFVYSPSGKLVGSFSEHHGQDRGPNRRARVVRLLGKEGARLL